MITSDDEQLERIHVATRGPVENIVMLSGRMHIAPRGGQPDRHAGRCGEYDRYRPTPHHRPPQPPELERTRSDA
jgi:hypothetical protein